MPAENCRMRAARPVPGRCQRDHRAGAAASVSELACSRPLVLIHLIVTLVPGRYLATIFVSAPGDVTAWPSTAVMTSPLASPAEAAGVPHSAPSTSAPLLAGAMLDGIGVAAMS